MGEMHTTVAAGQTLTSYFDNENQRKREKNDPNNTSKVWWQKKDTEKNK